MTNTPHKSSALVVFSGGQDSTTCLAWAMSKFEQVEAITFDYGQRHRIEINQAKKICGLKQIPHKIVKLDLFQQLTRSALTDPTINIKESSENTTLHATHYQLPTSFVPGRNLIFLSTAAIYAHTKGIRNLVTGVCQTDYSGYPDCRNGFIKSLEQTINLALGLTNKNQPAPAPSSIHHSEFIIYNSLTLHTPLMFLTKAESVKLMSDLGHLDLLKESHTCYEGLRPACGKCPACKLRIKGFQEAGIKDPLEVMPQ